MSSPLPPLKVQVAFASTPLDTTPTWTDISRWVTKIKTERGRSHILSRFEPGRLTLTCNGRDRALDPLNTASQFYPNVDVNKQIQVLVQWGGVWYPLYTGFIDDIAPQWLDNLNTDILITATDALRMLDTDNVTSTYRATVIADGASHLWPFDDPQGSSIVLDAVASKNGNYSGFYQLGAQGPSFTDIATGVTFGNQAGNGLATISSLGTIASALSMEVWFNCSTLPPLGSSANLYTTGGGPTGQYGKPYFVQSASSQSQLSATSASGSTLSAQINSRPGDLLVACVFCPTSLSGVFDDVSNPGWTLLQAITNSNAHVEIWACLAIAAVTNVTADCSGSLPPYSIDVLEFGGKCSISVDSSGGGSATATWSYASSGLSTDQDIFVGITGLNATGAFGVGPFAINSSSPSGQSGLAQRDLSTVGNSYVTVSAHTSYEVLSSTSAITYAGTITGFGAGMAGAACWVCIQPEAVTAYYGLRLANSSVSPLAFAILEADGSDGDTLWTATSNQVKNYADGEWHHAVLTADGSHVLRLYVDGVLASSQQMGAFTVVVVPSFSQVFNAFAGSLAYAAFYPSALSAATVLSHYQQGYTGFPIQDTGARIQAVLDNAGWPSAWYSIATGTSNAAQPTGPLVASGVYTYMQEVEKAEDGFLFVAASGIITFLNRATPLKSPANVSLGTFGENAGEIPYAKKPSVVWDNIDLFNASLVSRAAGTATASGVAVGTIQGVPQTASDSSSISQYGVTSTLSETGLLITTDAECLARAQWNVAHFAQINARVEAIVIEPLGDTATRMPQIVNRGLMDRITVKRRPWSTAGFGAPTFTQDVNIEHITHEIDKKASTWQTTYVGAPAETGTWWVLGTSALNSTTALAY